jgi:hypothetical protein
MTCFTKLLSINMELNEQDVQRNFYVTFCLAKKRQIPCRYLSEVVPQITKKAPTRTIRLRRIALRVDIHAHGEFCFKSELLRQFICVPKYISVNNFKILHSMKKTKLFYWIITGLFGAFMFFTAIPDIISAAEAVKFMSQLGYPSYFLPFIGVAKALGVIGILVPGFPRIREWAYAGLAFDLIGAFYSTVATVGLKPEALFIVLPLALLFTSYFLNRKKDQEVQLQKA